MALCVLIFSLCACGEKGRTQRSLPVRQRQEIQALSRKNGRIASVARTFLESRPCICKAGFRFPGKQPLSAPTHFCDLPSRYRPEAARPLPAPNSERPNKRILTDDTTERNAVKWSQKKSADAPKQRCRTRFKPYAYRDALLYLSSSFRCFRHEVSLRRKEFKAGANRMHDCGPQIANDGYRNSERERIWHM